MIIILLYDFLLANVCVVDVVVTESSNLVDDQRHHIVGLLEHLDAPLELLPLPR